MATLTIIAVPSEDLQHYRLWIDAAADDDYLRMERQDDGTYVGTYEVAGQCGDQSRHKLRYVLEGPSGASLSLKRRCDGGPEVPMPTVKIYEFSPAGGSVRIKL